MIDEHYDRMYQHGRAHLHGSLDHLFASIANSFKALHEVQWSAPGLPSPPLHRRMSDARDAGVRGGKFARVPSLASPADPVTIVFAAPGRRFVEERLAFRTGYVQ